jgi:hypothetical protein
MSDVNRTLHPNLARLAASYQQILGRLQRNEIDLPHAHVEIRELVARDDEGVQWTINPVDGGWLFLSRSGEWRPSPPPESGFATITPHDLRHAAGELPVSYNADWDLQMERVEDVGTGLKGSTRRRNSSGQIAPGTPWKWIAVGVVVLIGLLLLATAVRVKPEMIAPGPIVQMPIVSTPTDAQ